MRHHRALMTLTALLVLVAGQAAAGTARTEWDLTDMFADQQAFLDARASVEQRLPEMADCRGHLGDSAATMRRCADLAAALNRDYATVMIYAYLSLDRDLRNADAQQVKAETERVGVELDAATSWMAPEILALGSETVEAFLAEHEGLAPYTMMLRDTVRRADHTLPQEQEELLSKVGMISGKFSDIYGQLAVSDMPYPEVDLPGIGTTKLDQAAYVRYRGSADREVREAVFDAFWHTFADYENTFGTILNSEIQKSWFYAQTRGYPTCLAASYDGPNIPEEVYHSLIRDVRANLHLLHRALKLRQRILGLETQKYSDIYASIVPAVQLDYPWEKARVILGEAMAPLGSAYVEVQEQGLDTWIDVYPKDGKENGAYSAGGWYEGHPWVLLNYNSSYGSLSTTAHEMGHALHSWHSKAEQPFPTAGYAGVLAEVASTFNEMLLKEYLIAHEDDPMAKIFVLSNVIERMRQTIFRQTMFAEFELEIHKRVEQGQTLTGKSLSELYLKILRDYHGHDEGVMDIEELYAVEWAFIPHFYRDFYVYQYATGMIAATALAEQVIAGGPGSVERYLDFLSAGSSDYPMAILQRAGADLTSSQPTTITMAAFERTLDQIEELLAEVGG